MAPPKQVEQPPPAPKPNIKITVINAELLFNIEEGGTKMDPFVKFKYVTEDFKELWDYKTKVDMDSG